MSQRWPKTWATFFGKILLVKISYILPNKVDKTHGKVAHVQFLFWLNHLVTLVAVAQLVEPSPLTPKEIQLFEVRVGS